MAHLIMERLRGIDPQLSTHQIEMQQAELQERRSIGKALLENLLEAVELHPLGKQLQQKPGGAARHGVLEPGKA